ncbi:MAG: DUF2231 domain-containing protein [Gammaproteobacteria bacterium]|nr:DUF2231 domain-containing protein [Gammaproteobacteria bacterium]MDE0512581.1 DUF2231 domain-containing protein [Gammaproteobacteria bacterium]
MSDREVLHRHPFHPALVHFPIACWVLSHPADLAALTDIGFHVFELDWWAVSSLLVWIGVITAIPAMAVGVYDFIQLPDEDGLMQSSYRHISFVGTAWMVYLASGYIRMGDNLALAPAGVGPALVSGFGLICLCIGGWYGGKLVYKYHLGTSVARRRR